MGRYVNNQRAGEGFSRHRLILYSNGLIVFAGQVGVISEGKVRRSGVGVGFLAGHEPGRPSCRFDRCPRPLATPGCRYRVSKAKRSAIRGEALRSPWAILRAPLSVNPIAFAIFV